MLKEGLTSKNNPYETANNKNAENHIKLKREIGLFILSTIGVINLIESKMFTIPAVIDSVSESILVLIIMFIGIITIFFAITCAELGSAFPLIGEPYFLLTFP